MIELLLQAEHALSLGLLDRAETLYRQVHTSDPRNAIAVVGLARVALERGQEAQALVLVRRALAIDSENEAAQRLAQRLEEVLAFRGQEEARGPVSAAVPEPPAPPPEAEPPVSPPPAPGPLASAPPPRSWRDRLLRRPGSR